MSASLEQPDTILVATLLKKTTGPLQQHLRLNMRTLDTYDYENVKSVILAYYQSRHVTGSGTNAGPAPMDVGAQRQTGQRYIKEKERLERSLRKLQGQC